MKISQTWQVLAAIGASVLLIANPGAAWAQSRVALVIGNAAYAPEVGQLANPLKDAHLIASALEARQFKVTRTANLDRVRLLAAVETYARELAAAGPGAIGFVYYSGHGAANPDNGRNYLIPVDARSAADSTLWYQSVPLQEIVDTINQTAPQAANVVVFDACREALRLPGGKGLGNGAKGLHREQQRPSVLIAFSTSPDAIAADLDATATTGPYATELAAGLARPGIDLETMFNDVKYKVLSRTGEKQLPYIENGLRARLVLDVAPVQSATQQANYARWGLTERDFGVVGGDTLLKRVGAQTRLAELTRAAESGDTVAQTLVGIAFFNGIGTAVDYAKAVEWSRRAADAGNARAMNTVAATFASGTNKDYAEALRWYRKAADLGLPFAMKNIGGLYSNGYGMKQDYAEAIRWYRKAADLGESDAMRLLGSLYALGHGVKQDFQEAERWYRKAAALGDAVAMSDIGYLHETGSLNPKNPFAGTHFGSLFGTDRTQDYAEAMLWYRKAADLGHVESLTSIGRLHALGRGAPQDYTEAMRWYKKGADLGDPSGMTSLGALYLNGIVVKQDFSIALTWFRKAAQLEQSQAMVYLAYMYATGKGVALDYAEAVRWNRKAEALGDAAAINALGTAYSMGQGVPQDLAEGLRFYRKAADLGQPDAMRNIGWLYHAGTGVPKDFAEARRWWDKAAALGDAKAKAALERLKAEGH